MQSKLKLLRDISSLLLGICIILGCQTAMVADEQLPVALPMKIGGCGICDNDVTGWQRMNESIRQLCCMDNDGDGVGHCLDCSLDRYRKLHNGQYIYKYAGPHDCLLIRPLIACP